MDLIDQKFEKLKDQIYKLGIAPIQFRNMVEGKALFEWSPEVAIALGTRFCSWVVAEEDDEHLDPTEDSKSVGGVRRLSHRFGARMPSGIGKQRQSAGSNKPANDQGEEEEDEEEDLPTFGSKSAAAEMRLAKSSEDNNLGGP